MASIDTPRRSMGTTPETDTYRNILAAAREVFRVHGYNDVTVEELRRAAGVSRATFYFYFKDRREVVTRLVAEAAPEFHELYQRRYPHVDDFTSIVQSNIAYIAHYSRDYDLFAGMSTVLDNPTISRMIEEIREGFRGRVARKLRRLMDRGVIEPVDPEMQARILIGMVEDFTRQFYSLYTTKEAICANLALAVQHLSETWFRAVYAKEPPRPFPYTELLAQAEFGPLVKCR